MNGELEIINVSLFRLDIEGNQKEEMFINESNEDLSEYLNDLIGELSKGSNKRAFEISRDTTEVSRCLYAIYNDHDCFHGKEGEAIAARLLAVEVNTDEKYGHLGGENKRTHVNKGSFIQFLYKENNVLKYLGVKVEHQEFLEEVNFKKIVGLGVENKIYKAFRAAFIGGKISEVDVYDSQRKLAKYWWYGFLELSEVRTNGFNTERACKETISKINRLKRLDLNDYRELRNAIIVAFKQQGSMDYFQFVEDVVENFSSESEEVNKAVKKIATELKLLPESKGFDNLFDLEPSAVPFRKRNFQLDEGITLSINEELDDMDGKVWAEMTASGEKLVVIKSSEGYANFNKKERTL